MRHHEAKLASFGYPLNIADIRPTEHFLDRRRFIALSSKERWH